MLENVETLQLNKIREKYNYLLTCYGRSLNIFFNNQYHQFL